MSVAVESGTIVEVATHTLGDELVSDHAAGVTVLTVSDTVDFDEDGGTLTVGGEALTYLTIDDEASTITLATPLAAGYPAETRVELEPKAFEKFAQVMVGDYDQAVEAVVPHSLWDRIADGIRDGGFGEVVTMEAPGPEGGDFVITDVVGSAPLIDGSYLDPSVPLDPAIVPEPPPQEPQQPEASPTPEVVGGIGALFVRWAPINNATPVTVEVHVSPTTPVPLDGSALVAEVQGTQTTVRALADGTPLAYVDADGNPVVYYVALRAKATGDPTLVAPSSAEASGSMVQITGPDVAVAYVYAGNIVADQITGGRLDSEVVVGGDIYAEGAAGERVSLSGAGFTVSGPIPAGEEKGPIYVNFPTDGAKPNIFSGTVEANTAEIVGGLTMRSVKNMVASQATLALSSGVQAPQSPPATEITWPQVNIDTTTKRSSALGNFALDPGSCYGLTWDAGNSRWLTSQVVGEDSSRIWGISSAGVTSVVMDSQTIAYYGLARIGSTTYGLGFAVTTTGGFPFPTTTKNWVLIEAAAGATGVTYSRVNDNRAPTLGTDGTNLLVGERVPGSNELRVRVYSPDNLGQIDDTITTTGANLLGDSDVAGLARGTFDYGVTRIVTVTRAGETNDFQAFNGSGTSQPNEWWPRGPGGTRGLAWDGANFWHLGAGGQLVRYTPLKWTTESDKWWVGYSWRDTDTTSSRSAASVSVSSGSTNATAPANTFSDADLGSVITGTGIPASTTIVAVISSAQVTLSASATASGTITATVFSAAHETPLGPKVALTMKKRARLTITTAALPAGGGPDDPDRVAIYMGRGAGSGTPLDLDRTQMFRQVSQNIATYTTSGPTFSGTNPPTANNFPSTAPGKIASTAGGFSVDGNANGSIGTGTLSDSVRAAVGGRWQAGVATSTVGGSSGLATFAHSLGVTPTVVLAEFEAPGGVREKRITAKTATNFELQIRDSAGGFMASGTVVTVGYVAFV